jgi:predicted GIY-YIG superfamily endonuclease
MQKWYVYILECADKSIYVGATNNLERRFLEHKAGKGSKFVRSRKAENIVYFEEFTDKYEAYRRERVIKGYSRQKKSNLIKSFVCCRSPVAQW